jgi:glycosyltransferase involved in cell wall biosynthesis
MTRRSRKDETVPTGSGAASRGGTTPYVDSGNADRILVISPFDIFPPYWGAANRIYNLVKYLSKDSEVSLLYVNFRYLKVASAADPLIDHEKVRTYGVATLTRYSQVLNPLLLLTGLVLTIRRRYTLIVAETAWSALHAMLLSFLTRVPWVLDEHNVEFSAFERMDRGGRLGIRALRLYERIACRLASRVLCVSEEDREMLVSELNVKREKTVLVPNGVDTDRFHPDKRNNAETRRTLGVSGDAPLILFNGKLDYKPNVEAVRIILERILPEVLKELPGARFLVVGNNPPLHLAHDSLLFVGVVDRIEDYINASDVVICPLTSGGGTRFKILEAVACGRPVISTTIGAEGLVDEDTGNCLTCEDDWSRFANEVVRAVRDGSTPVAGAGFFERYGWRQVIDNLRSEVMRSS